MKPILTAIVAVVLLALVLTFLASCILWYRLRPKSRARTRLTATGAMAIAVAALMFIAGANTGTNLLYLLVAMDLGMLMVSVVAVDLNLRGLSVRRRAPVEVRVGADAPLEFWLRNDRRRLIATGVVVEERPIDGLDTTRPVGALFASVPPGKTAKASATGHFTRRGLVQLEGLMVSSAHPFGFLERVTTLDFPREVLVLPRVRPLRLDRLGSLLGADGEGEGHRWEGAEQTDRLRLLRDYRTGDSPRHVDWKRSARISRLTVREYDRPRARRRVIALLLFAGDPEDAIEDAVSLTLALIASFVEREEAPELLIHLPEARSESRSETGSKSESKPKTDARRFQATDEGRQGRWRGGALSVLDASRLLARAAPGGTPAELGRQLRGARRRGLEVLTVTSAAPGDPRLRAVSEAQSGVRLLSARDGIWFTDHEDEVHQGAAVRGLSSEPGARDARGPGSSSSPRPTRERATTPAAGTAAPRSAAIGGSA